MSSSAPVPQQAVQERSRYHLRLLLRAVGLPCAGAILFWLLSMVMVRGMDNSQVRALSSELHAADADVLAAPNMSYSTIIQLLSIDERWVSQAYRLSLLISLATMLISVSMMLLIVYGIRHHQVKHVVRPLLTFCSRTPTLLIGLPLAFAMTLVVSHSGFVAQLLATFFDTSLILYGVTPTVFWGLSLTYAVLQIPLLLLSVLPALADIPSQSGGVFHMGTGPKKKNRRTAATFALAPMFFTTTTLLFSNTVGAQIVTCMEYGCELSNLPYLLVDNQRTGDVLANPMFGYMLSLRLVLTMTIGVVMYGWMRTMSEQGKEMLSRGTLTTITRSLHFLRWLLH